LLRGLNCTGKCRSGADSRFTWLILEGAISEQTQLPLTSWRGEDMAV